MPFKENDIVLYTDSHGLQFKAKITSLYPDYGFKLTFLDDSYNLRYGRNENHYSNLYWSRLSHLEGRDKSVENRIKHLWNNSNWVRNNPAQAY